MEKTFFIKIRKWAEDKGLKVMDLEHTEGVYIVYDENLSFEIKQKDSTISKTHRGKIAGKAKGLYLSVSNRVRLGHAFPYSSQVAIIEEMNDRIKLHA